MTVEGEPRFTVLRQTKNGKHEHEEVAYAEIGEGADTSNQVAFKLIIRF